MLRLQGRHDEALSELRGAIAALPAKASPIRAGVLAQLALAEVEAGDTASALEHGGQSVSMMRALEPAANLQLATPLLACVAHERAGHAAHWGCGAYEFALAKIAWLKRVRDSGGVSVRRDLRVT